jgi:transcriptional regulator with XRE-family HTH domain
MMGSVPTNVKPCLEFPGCRVNGEAEGAQALIRTIQNSTKAAILPGPLDQAPLEKRRLHRLRSVRQSEGISRLKMARRLHTDVHTVTQQEHSTDLTLSTLYQWRAALGIPIEELLVETGLELSPPILKRSQMLRLMKTAQTIVEQTKQAKIQSMGQNLVDQILEIMPELEGVGAWPLVGQRRTLKELGRAAERFFADRAMDDGDDYSADG